MSVAVGIIERGQVWMGADTAITAGNIQLQASGVKMFRVKDLVIAGVGYLRPIQSIHYGLGVPRHPKGISNEEYVIGHLIPKLADCIEASDGVAEPMDSHAMSCSLLIGYRGNLFHIAEDFACTQPSNPYYAIGSGGSYAMAALALLEGAPPRERMELAMEVTSMFDPWVTAPFDILQV
jgi:ATP-dependent protease HslVU (ClpYQ) peptidase subunit